LSFDGTLGTRLGPRSPTSLMALYYRLAGEIGGRRAALALAGGNGSGVATTFRKAAEGAGATIRTNAPVRRILVEDYAAKGVELGDGEILRAPVVASAIDPKTTFLRLVGAHEL